MGDRPAEGALGRGPVHVDMDPLVVAGGVGELVDPLLGDVHPVGPAEVRAGGGAQVVERVEDASPPSGSLGRDGHDLAGHVRGVVTGEEGDHGGDLPRLGGPAEGLPLGELVEQVVGGDLGQERVHGQ